MIFGGLTHPADASDQEPERRLAWFGLSLASNALQTLLGDALGSDLAAA